LGGATNTLLSIADQAASGHLIGALQSVGELRRRHMATAEDLLGAGPVLDEVQVEMSATFDELAHLAEALSTLGHATERSRDAIASKGELLSASLVVPAFQARGIRAALVDPRDVMITNDQFGKAEPQTDRIAETSRRVLRPLVEKKCVPVLGGYVGATAQGVVTTLGRGGSDYSASLIGAAVGAQAIEIWTDVDGMLSADPRVVERAQLIECIRFDEASELASFGAKVLHPSTIAPAVRLGIPVYIYNSRNPAGRGTLITFDAPMRAVTAIAGKGQVTLIKVRSPRMLLQHGFMRTIFEVFDRHRTSVDVIATSEISVSLTIDDDSRLDSLIMDLSQLGDVSVERDRGIIALVGSGLGASSQTMARALGSMKEIRIHMLSLSASGINLTVVIDGDQVNTALSRLHNEFFPPGAA
jgi:aspartate kinase